MKQQRRIHRRITIQWRRQTRRHIYTTKTKMNKLNVHCETSCETEEAECGEEKHACHNRVHFYHELLSLMLLPVLSTTLVPLFLELYQVPIFLRQWLTLSWTFLRFHIDSNHLNIFLVFELGIISVVLIWPLTDALVTGFACVVRQHAWIHSPELLVGRVEVFFHVAVLSNPLLLPSFNRFVF